MLKALSGREIQIIKLIAKDRTNQQIANELKISCRTVEAHRRRGMIKIGCTNVAGPHPLRASRASDRCIGHGHLSGNATYRALQLAVV
jgi:DNA-binding NarL/FixJ family response regulator